jgi:hypothetical protein
MELILDNTDRRFDPMNTSSPYVGDLVAGTPIRFRADIGGTKYDVYSGFVDGWPAVYSEGGFLKEMKVSCHDIFKYFGERSAPDTMVEDIEALVGPNPLPVGIIRRWYRFDSVREGEGVIPDVYGTGPTDLTVVGKWDTSETIAPASNRSAIGIAQHKAPENTDNYYMGATNHIGPFDNAPIKSDHWAICMAIRVTDPGQMGGYSCSLMTITHHVPGAPGSNQLMTISLHQGGQHHPSAGVCPGCIYISTNTSGTSLFCYSGPGPYNAVTGYNPFAAGTFNPFDGQAHSLVVYRKATRMELWADGVLVAYDSTGGAVGLDTWDPAYELRVYWPFQGVSAAVGRTFPGVVFQEMIFMDVIDESIFVPSDIHDILMVGLSEVAPSGDAAAHLMNRVGWNPLKQIVDSCEVPVLAPANPYGRSILEWLQSYAASEDGRVFVGADGKVRFHSTARFQTQTVETTVQYAFDDTSATSVLIDGELQVVLDDVFIYQAAEVSRDGGVQQAAASTATPNKTYSLSGLRLLSDHQAKGRAEKIVWRYGTQRPRTESWQVWPEQDASDWPTLFGLDIGHRVQVKVTPGQVGSQIDLQQHLELIEHHVTPTDWTMTLNGSPVDDSTYLIWGGTGAQGWGNGVWR